MTLTSADDRVRLLLAKGARIPHPTSVFISEDVDLNRISGDITLHPGTRVQGASTVISRGCVLGAETPMTVDSCQLGEKVALKGGYAAKSVFLDGANMGSGAHVREGTILEEEAGGAHTVGLKQTILFPFVTLGSLINFCDCLMGGGTSRKDHSEVGSSYIHFNFTPDGNKTTASLFGDVSRGVMLNQPPIFLGGQGGTVGPVYTGFGTVVAAGSVLRSDVFEDEHLVTVGALADRRRPHTKHTYKALTRIVERNLDYIANLVALDAWYRQVRRPFFARQELGTLVYEGALAALASALDERTKRLKALVSTLSAEDSGRSQLIDNLDALLESAPGPAAAPETLLTALADTSQPYTAAIASLPEQARAAGTDWLAGIVAARRHQAISLLPALNLYETKS